MIVERYTWQAKPGRRGELVDLVMSWVEMAGLTPRVCTRRYGLWDLVSSELDFETEEDKQRFWARIGSIKEHAEIIKKLNDVVVPGTSTSELLNLH